MCTFCGLGIVNIPLRVDAFHVDGCCAIERFFQSNSHESQASSSTGCGPIEIFEYMLGPIVHNREIISHVVNLTSKVRNCDPHRKTKHEAQSSVSQSRVFMIDTPPNDSWYTCSIKGLYVPLIHRQQPWPECGGGESWLSLRDSFLDGALVVLYTKLVFFNHESESGIFNLWTSRWIYRREMP